jgi:hypothetical protein
MLAPVSRVRPQVHLPAVGDGQRARRPDHGLPGDHISIKRVCEGFYLGSCFGNSSSARVRGEQECDKRKAGQNRRILWTAFSLNESVSERVCKSVRSQPAVQVRRNGPPRWDLVVHSLGGTKSVTPISFEAEGRRMEVHRRLDNRASCN